ncbi:hypothetical protein [Xylophilus sp. ASV27]|uniref:hypothetical protein n=1 Tax=Xylophilus sp. ASV27 TaxID=2795129 RepID=UPI0018ED9457|nr:hypothetical protein [Xylophilus sp. ASV27]
MRRLLSPPLLVACLLMLVLAVAALAGTGCKRPAGQPPAAIALPALSMAAASGHGDAGLIVFEHPSPDARNLSAAAAQVALDTQVSNDDRTEMIEWAPDARSALVASHGRPPGALQDLPGPWPRGLLRPPRA